MKRLRILRMMLSCLLMPGLGWTDITNTALVSWNDVGGKAYGGLSNTVLTALTMISPPSNVRLLNFDHAMALNGSLSFGADGTVDHYDALFVSQGNGPSGAPSVSLRTLARAGSTSYSASTTNGVLSFKSVSGLQIGTYHLTVTATNSAGTSAPMETDLTLVLSDLANVRVYPNPWRADQHTGHLLTFDQMSTNSTVKIFTVSGHFVRSLDAPAGSVTWDLTNESGDKVASGIYIYLITNDQGQKARGKLAVIQ